MSANEHLRAAVALLEKIRHELTTECGLVACDGAAPGETWTLDHAALIAEIDAALSGLSS